MMITLTPEALARLVSEYIEVGFTTAVKYYQPLDDEIRAKDVKRWLNANSIAFDTFRRLVKAGRIPRRQKGASANSPYYYSIAEIRKALAIQHTTALTL